MREKGHSADYFGDTRDFWWNRDFLELMSKRWALGEARSVLNVGCGIGHWGRCLAPFLNPTATLIGVDREPRWIDEAAKRLPSEYLGRVSYQVGDAEWTRVGRCLRTKGDQHGERLAHVSQFWEKGDVGSE